MVSSQDTSVFTDLFPCDWVFWLLVIILIFFLLWLFFGGGDYEFVGLDPFKIGVDSRKYITDEDYEEIQRSNAAANRITIKNFISQKSENTFQGTTEVVPESEVTSESEPTERTVCKKDIYTPENQKRALGKYKCHKNNKLSKGEQLCKDVIQDIYQLPFYCVRPSFLKNPETGRNLELDLYNDQVKIAIEYNGIGHYVYPNPFHRTKEEFINQIRRDKFKVDMCDVNDVYLISVPYTIPLNYSAIKEYIMERLP